MKKMSLIQPVASAIRKWRTDKLKDLVNTDYFKISPDHSFSRNRRQFRIKIPSSVKRLPGSRHTTMHFENQADFVRLLLLQFRLEDMFPYKNTKDN